jgi:hypothetical protein
MIVQNNIVLKKPYISKKIKSSAIKTVLDSTYQTAYRLYLITNDIKELQEFAELEHEDYFLTALVKTECSLAGEAKIQAWNIKHLQPLLNKKPAYNLRCNLTHKMSNKEVYRCNLKSIKSEEIYNQIQECITEINNILKNEKNN